MRIRKWMIALFFLCMAGGVCACGKPSTEVESSVPVSTENVETTTENITEEETTTEEPTTRNYDVDLVGVTVNVLDEKADISKIPVKDLEDFKDMLRQLPNLTYIDMCDCGLSNEQMEELQKEFPNIKFAWMLYLGRWKVRTDAKAFSTLHAGPITGRLTNEEAQVLKYCTDLVALDLGHNCVTDIGFIKNMPELRILIMVDNIASNGGYIRDLSVLQYTPKLRYLEFFVGTVSDLSFLQYTPELRDLNISYNPISDITYLKNLPHIERLYLEHTLISYSDFQELKKLYPDAQVEYYGEGSIDHGWRTHPRYHAMIDMYHKDYLHELFMEPDELEAKKKADAESIAASEAESLELAEIASRDASLAVEESIGQSEEESRRKEIDKIK